MFTTYLQIHRHAICALCHREASHRGTAKQAEKKLLANGWRAIEIETPARVYGGLARGYCAETFCKDGVYQSVEEAKPGKTYDGQRN